MTEPSPAMLAARRLLSGSLPARVSVRFSGDTVRPGLARAEGVRGPGLSAVPLRALSLGSVVPARDPSSFPQPGRKVAAPALDVEGNRSPSGRLTPPGPRFLGLPYLTAGRQSGNVCRWRSIRVSLFPCHSFVEPKGVIAPFYRCRKALERMCVS